MVVIEIEQMLLGVSEEFLIGLVIRVRIPYRFLGESPYFRRFPERG